MVNANNEDIVALLEHWTQTKEQIAELEANLEKYKRLATRIMSQNNTNLLTDGSYTLKKRNLSRETISRTDLPKEIWKKYAKSFTYPAFYLSKNKYT